MKTNSVLSIWLDRVGLTDLTNEQKDKVETLIKLFQNDTIASLVDYSVVTNGLEHYGFYTSSESYDLAAKDLKMYFDAFWK